PRLMSQFRSSVVFLGAILARCGEATLSYPGGCELGPRPIDLHLAALRTLGAEIEEMGGILRCRGKLQGCEILLPFPSVGATENAMLAATAAEGVTVISNAAREPEIVDLQDFLQKLGVSIHGAGTSTITIRGGATLHEATHRPIPDRIVTATYLCAAAACGGDITLRDTDYRHLAPVTTALHQAGCCLQCREDSITLRSTGQLRSLPPVRTYPYPGFPTDAQPVLMAALLRAKGATMFVENIFENRYRHTAELTRMGADIRLEGKVALVSGVERLYGGEVHATDLRGGAALTVAALQAEGTTTIRNIHHILRGYEDITRDLRALGADITFTT
ncbi:MAG: UDP-N-acetylglucosamine 1-carboxyvinyltransferase, partial [Oscillospiraceae bacterium]|nr:UDP-N-acetylglucosamine 1-carboxyvinyltransferase [Oscillospiraceae bacterium]